MENLAVRRAGADDLTRIVALDSQGIHSTGAESGYGRDIERPGAYVDLAAFGEGDDETVVGFSNYWVVHDEIQILAVAVDEDYRRRGIARALLSHLLAFGGKVGCDYATIEVRRSNHAAIGLYHSFGFAAVSTRRAYYASNGEDAVVMTLRGDLYVSEARR